MIDIHFSVSTVTLGTMLDRGDRSRVGGLNLKQRPAGPEGRAGRGRGGLGLGLICRSSVSSGGRRAGGCGVGACRARCRGGRSRGGGRRRSGAGGGRSGGGGSRTARRGGRSSRGSRRRRVAGGLLDVEDRDDDGDLGRLRALLGLELRQTLSVGRERECAVDEVEKFIRAVPERVREVGQRQPAALAQVAELLLDESRAALQSDARALVQQQLGGVFGQRDDARAVALAAGQLAHQHVQDQTVGAAVRAVIHFQRLVHRVLAD